MFTQQGCVSLWLMVELTLIALVVRGQFHASVPWLPLRPGTGRTGVQTHWGQQPLAPGFIGNLTKAFDLARIDLSWVMVEPAEAGVFDFTAFDTLAAGFAAQGVTPMFILDYCNPLYMPLCNATSPYVPVTTPAATAAFARFAVAAMAHFKGKGVVWEVWNEPNGIGYATDPAGYAALVAAVGQARAAAGLEGELLVGPGMDGGWPILDGTGGWLDAVFAQGALQWLDAVSVHPYRGDGCAPSLPTSFCAPCAKQRGGCGPESLLGDLVQLRALIARHVANRTVPVLASEVGWSTCAPHTSPRCCAQGHALNPGTNETRCIGAWFSGGHRDAATQAKLVARQFLVGGLGGLALTVIYDYKDDGPSSLDSEANFGVTFTDGTPKPAYHAATVLKPMLATVLATRQLSASPGGTLAAQFLDAAAATVFVAVWNPRVFGSDGAASGVVATIDLAQAAVAPGACFLVRNHLGERHGQDCCMTQNLTVLRLAGVSDGPLYLVPTNSTVEQRWGTAAWPAAAALPTPAPGSRLPQRRGHPHEAGSKWQGQHQWLTNATAQLLADCRLSASLNLTGTQVGSMAGPFLHHSSTLVPPAVGLPTAVSGVSAVRAVTNVTLFAPGACKGSVDTCHYPGQWMRDFAYAATNAFELLPNYTEAWVAADLMLTQQRGWDGVALVDIAYVGSHSSNTGWYFEYGPCPFVFETDCHKWYNATNEWSLMLDSGPFAVKLARAFSTRQAKAAGLPPLITKHAQALIRSMDAVPRADNGLVYNDMHSPNVTYGFTDTVVKEGHVLYTSLLYYQAAQHLSQAFRAAGIMHTEAAEFEHRGALIAKNLNSVFWDAENAAFRSSTGEHEHGTLDVWGTAFAGALGLTSSNQTQRICLDFLQHRASSIFYRGHVRHLPAPMLWQKMWRYDVPAGTYQNGGFWSVPLPHIVAVLVTCNKQVCFSPSLSGS